MPLHYPYSPSSTERWLACPGSVQASLSAPPQTESSYAKAGRAAHADAESCLRAGRGVRSVVDLATQRNVHVEAGSAVDQYLKHIEDLESGKKLFLRGIERQLVHPTIPDFGGTVDYFCAYKHPNADGLFLHIVDYKHGEGVPVYAQENKQMLSYAAIITANYPGLFDAVAMEIIQPRATETQTRCPFYCTVDYVRDHEKEVRLAQQRSTIHPGKHCRWCPAATTCDALTKRTQLIAQLQFIGQDHRDLWLELHELAPVIKANLDRIEQELVRLSAAGIELPEHKVIESRSHRKWDGDEKDMLKELARRGVPTADLVNVKIKTPPQIERDNPNVDISDLTIQHLNGYRVVPEDHKHRAVDLSAKGVFPDDL